MSDRSANRPVPSEAGFTLIEIIVALALLSLIMGILAGSVKTARNVLAVIEANNTHSAIVPAQSYLRSAFAQTVPGKSALAIANQTAGLLGEPTRVGFNTFYATRGQICGLYHVEIHLEPARGGSSTFDLIAIQTLVRPIPADGTDAPAPGLRSTLASNVRAVSFGYFGINAAEPDDWQWLDSWSSAERLPRLVRIDVTFGPGQTQNWRDVIFPLQLSE